jgi:hypothetical protein
VQVRAAGAGGEAGVFVFGVDDPALGALVGVAQDFQLGQVGLPGAGAGEGDGVVVVACPPVPGDQARPGGVRAVQDAGQRVGVGGVAGQVGEVNGNAAASAAVSIVRVSLRASVPAGRVVTQPWRERKVAGQVTSSSELATARTAAISSARSSSVPAWTVR